MSIVDEWRQREAEARKTATKALVVLNRDSVGGVCISVVHPTAPIRKIDIYLTAAEFERMMAHEPCPRCEFVLDPLGGTDRWQTPSPSQTPSTG